MTHIDIVFDGPPSHESGRFVEVEDHTGKSIRYGEWVHRDDGYWVLRLTRQHELRGLLYYFLSWVDMGFLVPENPDLPVFAENVAEARRLLGEAK